MTAEQIQAEIEERVERFVPKALQPTATVSFLELFLRHLKDERRRESTPAYEGSGVAGYE
jgi:hypothetical protein